MLHFSLESALTETSHRLAQIGRGNAQGFAVFGDGAAGDLDALFGEHVGEVAVGEGFVGALGRDELFDQRAHSGAGGIAAGFGVEG